MALMPIWFIQYVGRILEMVVKTPGSTSRGTHRPPNMARTSMSTPVIACMLSAVPYWPSSNPSRTIGITESHTPSVT